MHESGPERRIADDLNSVYASIGNNIRGNGQQQGNVKEPKEQDVMQAIHDEVLQNLPPGAGEGSFKAHFYVRWDLRDHVRNELDGSTDIGQVLTLTGGGVHAYASRCTDYLKWLWKGFQYDMCKHVQQYLDQKAYSQSLRVQLFLETDHGAEHPDSKLNIGPLAADQGGIIVTVTGVSATIIAVAQQLAWMTAALRSSSTGTALSNVDFSGSETVEFFIKPGALTTLPSDRNSQGACWHRLTRNAAIAHGFPIPHRSDQAGLELPFTVMLKLSRVSSLVVTNQRLAFYGFSSLLFPTARWPPYALDDDGKETQQSIQWHFETNEERDEEFDCADYLAESECSWADDVAQASLTTSRHFVGLCRVAEVRLGTSDSDFANFQESPLPEASTTSGARIVNFTVGTSGLGFATAEFESNIIYAQSIVNPVVPDEYLGTLDTIRRLPVILWDCGDQCGWLVPAQALLLHMAHVWVQANEISANFQICERGLHLFPGS